MTYLALTYLGYYLFIKKDNKNDYLPSFITLTKQTYKFFHSLFNKLYSFICPKSDKNRADSSQVKTTNSNKSPSNCQPSKNDAQLEFPKHKYCLIEDFTRKISNPTHKAIFQYYLDNEVKNLKRNILVELDTTITEAKYKDLKDFGLVFNIPMICKIIKHYERELTIKGMLPVIKTIYLRH